MSLNDGNNYYRPLQHQQMEKMIKTEPSDDDLFMESEEDPVIITREGSDDDQFLKSEEEDFLLLNSAKLKCEDEPNEAGYGPSSELCNFETPLPIKHESKESSGELDIEEHKPGWNLLTMSRDSVGIVRNNYYHPFQHQQVEKMIKTEPSNDYLFMESEKKEIITKEGSDDDQFLESEEEREIIAMEGSDDDQFLESEEKDFLLLNSVKLICEDEQNEAGCGTSSELCNFENTFKTPLPIKHESESSSEEIDIDHKPGLKLLTGSRDSVGIVKGGLDPCESVQGSALQARSTESDSGGELKYNCAHCLYKTNYRSNFSKHYKNIHSKHVKLFKCKECYFETKYKYNVIRHYSCKHATGCWNVKNCYVM